MTHIAASDLHRMIEQVTPHMSDDDTLPVINAIHLEARNHDLTAVATDRYTIGVGRTNLVDGDRWTALIPAVELASVTAWLKIAETTTVSIVAGFGVNEGDSTLTFSGNGGSLRIAYPTSHYGHFPNWRSLLRDALNGDPQAVPLSGLTTKFLDRWQHADKTLHFFQAGPKKPLVFLDDTGDFIGMQMPINNEQVTRTQLASRWSATLTRFAYFEGEGYNLDIQWADKQGDPWEYTGNDRIGEPLMRLVGIEDDDHTLASVIAMFGPLSPINA
ncbi:DNA polymerase III subunit beta family protein [Streptomyces sp. NBC_01022]|uniref:DNA polymerase III subunit beta family protein n=1 Tax=Streptomyces sp. NBC_01022 TaxID=2903723 RepID=UPI002DDA207A|nr:phiSA1p31-related protein [Streptomyces sp. NBC_01022]WRZ84803.1 phiSA1p31-related protein [Streptomyces sp. NBC_01022]